MARAAVEIEAAVAQSKSARPTDFQRDGYAVLPAFLDAQQLARARNEVARLCATPGDPSCVRPHNTLRPLRWSDVAVDLVLSSPRLALLADVLDADDLRWISGYVSTKEPRSGPLAWHQDWWCWDHPVSLQPRAPQVALLSYLTATDPLSGALRVLPGSHLKSTPLHQFLPAAHDDEATVDRAAVGDVPHQRSLCLAPGDAVVLDYRLLHGTHANAADKRRDALLLSFTPSWRDLPDDVRAHLVSHPAQPVEAERPTTKWAASLLPHYSGIRRDLPLNRVPPPAYVIT